MSIREPSMHTENRPKRLGEVLLERGLITPERLEAALLEQTVTKERLGKIMIRNGFLRQDTLFSILLELNPNELNRESVYQTMIPVDLLIRTKTMVVASAEEVIYLSTLSKPWQVRKLLQPYVPGRRLEFSAVNPERLTEYLGNLRTGDSKEVLTWEQILHDAMRAKASDIHIIPRTLSYTVQTRIDGVLHLTHEGDREEYNALVSRIKDLSRMDMAERRRPQDGGFSLEYSGRVVSFRVVTVPTVDGERMVVRVLDGDSVNMSLEALGISELATWRNIVSKSSGLCLICGPTGSGKTTTLASTVREMNFLERAIYSVEDPVEHRLPYAGQVNTNPAVGLDFSSAVRNFMRADPDVIIVGEVREIDTARNALKGSETGHLVLATLHTSSIVESITRLRDIGVQPFELRHLLRGVLVQRLMRVYCKACAGKGCPTCAGTGYKGREVVSEVAQMRNEYDVDRVIEGDIYWKTIIEDARDKVLSGRTSEAELVRVFGVTLDEVEQDLQARRTQAAAARRAKAAAQAVALQAIEKAEQSAEAVKE